MTLLILTSAFAAGSVVLAVIGVALLLNDKTVSERLDMYLAGTSTESITLQEWELAKPFSERVIMPLIKRLARIFSWMWPQNRISMLRARLTMAGDPSGISPGDFVGVKGFVMVATVAITLLFGFLTGYPLNYFSMVLLVLLGFCGFFMPDIWLSRRIRQRQQGLI